MFKRRRSQRVHPDVLIQDAYIKRRYEDLSLCIHKDIKNGRGRYNYYAPWLELKLQTFPAFYREKHSVLEHNLSVMAETSDTPQNVIKPSTFVPGSESMNPGAPKNAWVQEDKDNKAGTEMCIHVNKAQASEATAAPNLAAEERGNCPRVGVVSEIESIELERWSSTVVVRVQEHNNVSVTTTRESETINRVTPNSDKISDQEETKSAPTSLPVTQSDSSVRSRLCTIL